MVITLTYNKITKELTLSDDEVEMQAALNNLVDTTNELSFEISLNTSLYQTQFEDDINGDNN